MLNLEHISAKKAWTAFLSFTLASMRVIELPWCPVKLVFLKTTVSTNSEGNTFRIAVITFSASSVACAKTLTSTYPTGAFEDKTAHH